MAIVAILSFSSFDASAYSRQTHSWYCMRAGNKPPSIESQMAFVKDHDGYFLDENASENDPVIYLTFDAGYENGNIADILDTLKKHDVKAAFFILKNLITKDTELVKRMGDEGHLVCNHTASHKDMTSVCSIEEFSSELKAIEDIYRENTGREMAKFYRPPEGKISEENMYFADTLGYDTVFWSFAYADWDNNDQPDPDTSRRLILDNTHNGMVLLLHPTSATNANILDSLICEWKAMGYRFGDLNELCKK